MEEALFPHIPPSELLMFEKEYEEAENASNEITFHYACALIYSEFSEDNHKGIQLLEKLAQNDSANKRDYIYLLALGNTRIRRYDEATKYCEAFLRIEPNNQQVIILQEYIKKDTKKRVAIAAGLIGLGGVIGLVAALMAK